MGNREVNEGKNTKQAEKRKFRSKKDNKEDAAQPNVRSKILGCNLLLNPVSLKGFCGHLTSIYFFALSQAPPELDIEMPSWIPETRMPARRPAVQFLPKRTPATIGDRMTMAPGASISCNEAFVEISMHRL